MPGETVNLLTFITHSMEFPVSLDHVGAFPIELIRLLFATMVFIPFCLSEFLNLISVPLFSVDNLVSSFTD